MKIDFTEEEKELMTSFLTDLLEKENLNVNNVQFFAEKYNCEIETVEYIIKTIGEINESQLHIFTANKYNDGSFLIVSMEKYKCRKFIKQGGFKTHLMDKTAQDNEHKVQNTITTNVYGNQNPVNIASGNNVSQSNTITFSTENHEVLEKLGVEKQGIDELKAIIEAKDTDKSTMKSKAMKWLGSVSASITAKGLSDNIPTIIDYVNGLI